MDGATNTRPSSNPELEEEPFKPSQEASASSARNEVELRPLMMPGKPELMQGKIEGRNIGFNRVLWKLIGKYADQNNITETVGLEILVKKGLQKAGIEIPSRKEAHRKCKVVLK